VTHNQFKAKYIRKYANPDPHIPNQCVDLANLYLVEVLGLPKIWGNAIDWDRNYNPAKMIYIRNTVSFVPRVGDIAVFGWKVGKYGHVDIVDNYKPANRINFWSFSQNWPLWSKSRVVIHPMYYGVKGFLRKR
jgi:surface antigen